MMNDKEFFDLEPQAKQVTPAETILLLSQKIATMIQLSNFIMATQHGKNAETGVQMVVQLQDNSQTRLFVNSKLLVESLIKEFANLGQELEASGVDLGSLLEEARARFNSSYPQQNPQG
jgi:hypothetical protein